MGKNVIMATLLGLFLGPLGYIYLGRKAELIMGIVMVAILYFALGLSFTLFLWIFFAYHCYIITRNINRSERRSLRKLEKS